MNKKETEALSENLLIADILLRLKALENLLISKSVFTQIEFSTEMETITRQFTKVLLEKANVSGDLDEIISSLEQSIKGN